MRRACGVFAPSPIVDRCFTMLLAVCAWVLLSIASIAIAQTGPITPFGLNTQVSNPIAVGGQTQYDITGGTRPGGGSGTNLFHSFGDFGVPPNNIANFLNGVSFDLNGVQLPAGLQTNNILARVTGTNGNNPTLSSIYGTIQTTGFLNANLFLMNPAGFLFGPNATVNVGGMVSFTSADYLKLTDKARFNAIPDAAADALLSASPVASFGFLGSNPGAITVQGSQFTVTEGTGISLIGGNISIGADPDTGIPVFISAPSGKIDLVSVASPGEVLYPSLQSGPNVNGQSFSSRGSVSISDFSFIDISGMAGAGNEAGGAVRIRSGQFVMDNLSVIQNMTLGDTAGENPGISIVVDHDIRLSSLSIISVGTGAGLGRSGNLDVSAENIEILSGSLLTSTSGGPASPGDITITATKSLTLSGLDPFVGTEPSRISTTAQSSVEGGNITITLTGSSLSVQDNAAIGTFSDTGRAGNITLNSDVLNVTSGGAVRTTSSNGSSGTIMVVANQSAIISGQSALGNFSSIANSSQTSPANISITAGQFVLADKAGIDGDTASQQGGTVSITAMQSINISGNSTIRSSTAAGTGTSLELSAPSIAIDQGTLSTRISGSNPNNVGGTIKASATKGNLTVSNNSLIAASTIEGAADGGRIELSASDSIIVTANSRIESTSTGTGNAGNILINAGQNYTSTDSAVTTQAAQASGGNITVLATDMVQLTNSLISASVADGPGGGGNISIDPQFVILQNSQILAQAAQGQGGAITITTNLFLPDANSIVNADSGSGVHGTVTIQSPNAPGSGKIQPLGKTPLQATSLLNQPCASLAGGEFSSFTVAGRDSLPIEPGSWLASPLYAAGVGEGQGVRGKGQEGDAPILSLRQIAPAGFLTQAFALDWSASCTS